MKGTTNAQRNAIVDSTSAVDSLTLTKADGTTQKHTVSNIIPKDDAPTSGSSKFVTSGVIYTALDKKVDKVTGKGLSTNDYTDPEKTKVSNLPANANTTFATKTELTDALSSVYKYKGSVNTYGNLPSNATAGDVYNVVASHDGVPAGTNWAWNGSSWDALGGTVTGYVADTTTVNGKPLSSNVTLAAADVGAVPTSRTVNGKALSGDISLTASDVGALASGGTAAKATADASGNNIVNTYATKAELTNGLAGKQNSLTFDSAPTSGSSNPVTSGGVYSAINTVNTSISSLQSLVANKQDKLTFDTTPTSGSSNPITSGGVYTAINSLESQMPSGGEEGQVWTSDGSGAGYWADKINKVVYGGIPITTGIKINLGSSQKITLAREEYVNDQKIYLSSASNITSNTGLYFNDNTKNIQKVTQNSFTVISNKNYFPMLCRSPLTNNTVSNAIKNALIGKYIYVQSKGNDSKYVLHVVDSKNTHNNYRGFEFVPTLIDLGGGYKKISGVTSLYYLENGGFSSPDTLYSPFTLYPGVLGSSFEGASNPKYMFINPTIGSMPNGYTKIIDL